MDCDPRPSTATPRSASHGLAELRAAPLVEEEYHGPVLMEADAAAGTLKELLARSFAAERPALGTEARTTGPFAPATMRACCPSSWMWSTTRR